METNLIQELVSPVKNRIFINFIYREYFNRK